MKYELAVEAGGERFTLTLQTRDLEAHSKLQKETEAVEMIMKDAQFNLITLLSSIHSNKEAGA